MRKCLILALAAALVCGLCVPVLAQTPYTLARAWLEPDPVFTLDGSVRLTGTWSFGQSTTYHVTMDWLDGYSESFYTTATYQEFTHQYDTTDKFLGYQWLARLTVTNGNTASDMSSVILKDVVVPVGIKFEGPNEFSLSKRGVLITDPIWIADPNGAVTKNDPACYFNNTTLDIRVDIAGSLPIPPEGLRIKVRLEGHNGNTGATLIPSSVMSHTVYNWSDPDYDVLHWSSLPLPAFVTKYPLHLQFTFMVYDATWGTWVLQNRYESGPHYAYTVMGTPLAPMAVPWTEVIDRAATWCDGLLAEAGISNHLVEDLYNANWLYDGTRTHSYWSGGYTNQTLKLGEMLDSTWADCKDFGNFYTCLMRCLGYQGQAYFLLGPFNTKPILGSNHSQWQTMSWNHHQFGWHPPATSLVHDASLKLNQPNPLYAWDMARDTTYKNYLYQSGTWTPIGPLVCQVQ